MNQKVLMSYDEMAKEAHLHFDEESLAFFGEVHDYTICVKLFEQQGMVIYVSVGRDGNPADRLEMNEIVKSCPQIRSVTVHRHKVGFAFRKKGKDSQGQQLRDAIDAVTIGLQRNRYINCCEECGQPRYTGACHVSGAAMLLCEECFARLSSDTDLHRQQLAQKQENLVAGIVGALLGSLLGAAIIVILAQIGYVAAISGVAMAVCTLKGYELLSGKLSNRGIVISCVIMLGMIYLANRVDWSISAAQYFEVDFFSAFRAIPMLIQEEVIEKGQYYLNLGLVYLFAVLGAVPTIITSAKNRGVVNTAGRMQESKNLNNTPLGDGVR